MLGPSPASRCNCSSPRSGTRVPTGRCSQAVRPVPGWRCSAGRLLSTGVALLATALAAAGLHGQPDRTARAQAPSRAWLPAARRWRHRDLRLTGRITGLPRVGERGVQFEFGAGAGALETGCWSISPGLVQLGWWRQEGEDGTDEPPASHRPALGAGRAAAAPVMAWPIRRDSTSSCGCGAGRAAGDRLGADPESASRFPRLLPGRSSEAGRQGARARLRTAIREAIAGCAAGVLAAGGR